MYLKSFCSYALQDWGPIAQSLNDPRVEEPFFPSPHLEPLPKKKKAFPNAWDPTIREHSLWVFKIPIKMQMPPKEKNFSECY